MAEQELRAKPKKCPFCGSAELRIGYCRDGKEINCSCGLTFTRYHGYIPEETEAKLIAAWNTRPAEDALREALENSLKAMIAARDVLLMYGGNKMPTQDAVIEQARAALAESEGR